MIKIGSINAGSTIRRELNLDFRLSLPDALTKVEASIDKLGELVRKGGKAGCDIVVLPEDCLCTSAWENGNPDAVAGLLGPAVEKMLSDFGKAAAETGTSLICCNDRMDVDGNVRNTAFLLGRDGGRIGQYDKVILPVQESAKKAGDSFSVFETDDLGKIGILICYDIVFPESARCLALEGADIIYNPTVGGAAFGGAEMSRGAFRTRAIENFTPVVVSWGGWSTDSGSMIISAKGEVLAEAMEAGEIAIADVDPKGGRENADWSNAQKDMRARLFRERRPDVFSVLSDPTPPVLATLPEMEPGPPAEIAEIYRKGTTVGHLEFESAQKLMDEGNVQEAIVAFKKLIADYPNTWFDRTAQGKLVELKVNPDRK
jgi:predicted amidohydrolase